VKAKVVSKDASVKENCGKMRIMLKMPLYDLCLSTILVVYAI
jgi:hypothetical protein